MACGRKLSDSKLDVIKSIASRTQTVQVLIGTYELLAFRNPERSVEPPQRYDLHFLRYRAEEQADIEIFQEHCVPRFRRSCRLAVNSTCATFGIFSTNAHSGASGVLKRLVDACRDYNGPERRQKISPEASFTRAKVVALSASQCEKILAEARDGELRLCGDNGAAQNPA